MPPVVAVLPIYIMFQQLQPARHPCRAHRDLHGGQPADRRLAARAISSRRSRSISRRAPQIDGASKFRIFFTIALPLARSGLVATFLLVLILSWNEYLLALFLSNANAQTMPILVSAQNGTRGPQWWYMSVLIVIMIAPVVAITIALQKQIARGLLVGAMKG